MVVQDGVPTAFPADQAPQNGHQDLLEVVYDCGPVKARPACVCLLLMLRAGY